MSTLNIPLFNIYIYYSRLSCVINPTHIYANFRGPKRHKMTHKGWRVVKPQHNQIHGPKGVQAIEVRLYIFDIVNV